MEALEIYQWKIPVLLSSGRRRGEMQPDLKILKKVTYICIYEALWKNVTEKWVEIIGSWCKIRDSLKDSFEEDMAEVKEEAMKIPEWREGNSNAKALRHSVLGLVKDPKKGWQGFGRVRGRVVGCVCPPVVILQAFKTLPRSPGTHRHQGTKSEKYHFSLFD